MANYATGCPCGSAKLSIMHSMGAQVSCPECGRKGPFTPGNNYQREEAAAIRAWNESVAADGVALDGGTKE